MVKKLGIVLILINTLNVFANVNISIEKEDIDGLKQLAVVNQKKPLIVTNTNEFSIFNANGIGKFSVGYKLGNEFKKINELYVAINKIDQRLQKANASFEKLNPVKRHSLYIKMGKYKVPQTHPYFNELWEQIKKILLSAQLTKVEVVQFSKGPQGPQYTYYKNDKVIKQVPISLNFHCNQRERGRICLVKKFGHLLIRD